MQKLRCYDRCLYWLMPILLILTIAAGCDNKTPEAAGNAGNQDLQHAQQLWTQIENYTAWTAPEGFEGFQDGKSPHGSVLRYYINDIAQADLTQDGAVIVKENYSEQSDEALMSVTVMQKRAGYDPETENWFYVKYAPDGTVMTNEQGAALAGRVGKGKAKGCVPCHASAGGDDYLFMND